MKKAKWNVLILTSAMTLTLLGAHAAAAPRPGEQSQSEQAAKKETAPDSSIYRVSYKVNEVENGKTINSRSYTLMAQTDDKAMTRIGSAVPYSVGSGTSFQYKDVYMRIDSILKEKEGHLRVETRLDMSTVMGKQTIPTGASTPVFGQLNLQDVTSATIGKPAFVGAIDDVSSNRQYVIEVTVTKAE